MTTYKVFTHPSGSTELVKQGWSWPAFLLPPLWALFKRLWGFAAGAMLFGVGFMLVSTVTDPDRGVPLLLILAELALRFSFGLNGNSWREANLVSRGFAESRLITVGKGFPAVKGSWRHPRMQALWSDPVWSKIIASLIIAVVVGISAYMNGAVAPQPVFDPRATQYAPGCRTAVLNGMVRANGAVTTVWFDWGPTPELGTSSLPQTFTQDERFYQHLSGLSENTPYYYRAVAENSHGRMVGKVIMLVTARC